MKFNTSEMNDGKKLDYIIWESLVKAKGTVIIVHGMAEHILRYEEFAKKISIGGYNVLGYNQRGHGTSVDSIKSLGDLGLNGWNLAIDDINKMVKMVKEKFPGLPVYIFGHSMGSFISRGYVKKYSEEINGLICSGTGDDSGILGIVMLILSKIISKLSGKNKPALLIDKIVNSNMNKKIKDKRTEFDWLSTDNLEVDKYINDELCGTLFPNSFYVYLFTNVIDINKQLSIDLIDKNLSIFLLSGSDDPVGNYSKGVLKVYEKMKKSLIKDVTIKFYSNGRHEMLNEINKKDVIRDIVKWLDIHTVEVL